MLFLFTNDTSSVRGHGKLSYDAKVLKKELGLEILPVAIGENAFVDDLEEIASMPDRVIDRKSTTA